jgi:ribosomal-protein-alanine N-acetyltransferase
MSDHKRPIRVESDRLSLREYALADVAAVHAYASDPSVTRFLVWGPNTADDTRQFIARAVARSESLDRISFNLAVIHNESQRLIGGAALRVVDRERQHAEIGYLLNREFWNQGYATEAARALLGFGFNRLRLRRISATCEPDNRASARVLQKAGMQFEAVIDSHPLVRGSALVFTSSRPDPLLHEEAPMAFDK